MHGLARDIGMGMQCGPVEGFTRQVSLYWNEQLLMYLHEKTLQERQQALFLEFDSKGTTRLLIIVFIYAGISEGKESCSLTNTTID